MPAHQPDITLTTLIADDEPVAREGMRRLVHQTPFLQLAGLARNTSDLSALLSSSPIDLLLLDIQMPGATGIDWLRGFKDPPLVIFTTAYSEYAIQGFELNAVDYLLKPVTPERFIRAAGKALDLFTLRAGPERDASAPAPPYIFVKVDRQQRKLLLDDILYIEGMLNYVIIHTSRHQVITYTSLKNMLQSLPALRFVQIHKSYIVALDKIKAMSRNELLVEQHHLPVSRGYRPALEAWLATRKLQ